MTCARRACSNGLKRGFYRIWNEPHKHPGYRDYCIACGRRIIEFNENDTIQLKYEVKTSDGVAQQ